MLLLRLFGNLGFFLVVFLYDLLFFLFLFVAFVILKKQYKILSQIMIDILRP